MRHKTQFRVITIGDASVGKTSLLLQLTEHQFNSQQPATIGANFLEHTEDVDGAPVNLRIWDTAGQERFRAIAPVYFRNADAAIAVFAMDAPTSFDSLQEQITMFLNVAGDSTVVIAANKVDLAADLQSDRSIVKEYAAAQGWEVFFTSAKTGEGISHLVSRLCRILTTSRQPNRAVDELTQKNQEDAGCCW
jgi:small GTP-binding protein